MDETSNDFDAVVKQATAKITKVVGDGADELAVGRLINVFCHHRGEKMMRILAHALEDGNYHNEAAYIRGLADNIAVRYSCQSNSVFKEGCVVPMGKK